MTEIKIPFDGNYWWGDSENVTNVLEKEIKNIFSRTRISSIEITGSDFNDGRENHKIQITISNHEICIKKEGGA